MEAGLPEMAGATVLGVGLSRNGFIEALHEPTEAGQALSIHGSHRANGLCLDCLQRLTGTIALVVYAAKTGAPNTAGSDVIVGRVRQAHQVFSGAGHVGQLSPE